MSKVFTAFKQSDDIAIRVGVTFTMEGENGVCLTVFTDEGDPIGEQVDIVMSFDVAKDLLEDLGELLDRHTV